MSSPLSQVTARPRDGGSPWPVFAVCAISFAVVMFDLAVVNVAFPDILSDFEITRADGSWMVSLYDILFGSLLVVAGKTADSVGRRKALRIGQDSATSCILTAWHTVMADLEPLMHRCFTCRRSR